MRTAAITAEMASARLRLQGNEAARDLLAEMPPEVVESGLIGLESVSLNPDGTYEPDYSEHGSWCLISPLFVLPDETPRQVAPSDQGVTIDLVAWDPRTPERFATRCGLGRWLGYVAWNDNSPTRIFRSPTSWYRNGCNGLCFVTRDPVIVHYALQNMKPPIIAEDRQLAAWLRQCAEHPRPAPRIIAA